MELWEYVEIQEQTSVSYRGRYLNEAVTVEMVMDDLLLVALAKDKNDQMWLHRVFFGHFAFGSKAHAIRTLSTAHGSLQPRIRADRQLLDDLDEVVRYRNRFAHDTYQGGWEPDPPETIRFCTFEAGENVYHDVIAADFETLIQKAKSVTERLLDLWDGVREARGTQTIGRRNFPTRERWTKGAGCSPATGQGPSSGRPRRAR